jgi:DNA recombination protein RmuC
VTHIALVLLALVASGVAAAALVRAGRSPGARPVDGQVAAMSAELARVTQLLREVERDRAEKFGELAGHLRAAGQQTAALTGATQALREALASTKARGQWGERMAEDVLRLAGFVENVNYRRQRAVEGGRVPDFTFLLPKDLCLHMDVKFPLDNYVRSLEAPSEAERARCHAGFLRDVRHRIRELAARGYASGRGTVDCVLMFIPNEQLYGWIQEHDPGVMDEALRQKVVLCSPLTLFAVLAVIRQAVDNFVLEETSTEILALLGGLSRQWEVFSAQMDRVGDRLESAHKEFESLSTTRRRMLERQLGRIDDVRARRGVAGEEADCYPLRLDA